MRRLSDNEEARKAQGVQWSRHMERQFSDRRVYWDNRGLSRLGAEGPNTDGKCICIIVDSMDHSKWTLPRSALLQSKTFGNFVKPHLDCTAAICHGHFLLVGFGESHVSKGADWTIELLTYMLGRLRQLGLDLREYQIILQSDNATKEAKNNACLRWLSYLTARGSIRSGRLNCLVSGRREDVDQFFSLLGSFLSHEAAEMYSPDQFMSALRKYLDNPSIRPLEGTKEVIKIDKLRDWPRVC